MSRWWTTRRGEGRVAHLVHPRRTKCLHRRYRRIRPSVTSRAGSLDESHRSKTPSGIRSSTARFLAAFRDRTRVVVCGRGCHTPRPVRALNPWVAPALEPAPHPGAVRFMAPQHRLRSTPFGPPERRTRWHTASCISFLAARRRVRGVAGRRPPRRRSTRRSNLPCGRLSSRRVDRRCRARLKGELGAIPRRHPHADVPAGDRGRFHHAASRDGVRGAQPSALTATSRDALPRTGFRTERGRRRHRGHLDAEKAETLEARDASLEHGAS